MSEEVQFIKKRPAVEENVIPPQYVKVSLSSVGKLNLPSVIHVKNYSGQDTLDLALASEKNMLSTTLFVIKKLIYEDIPDIEMLHYDELEEIMMNIYSIFWGQEIPGVPYPYTDEELDEVEDEALLAKIKDDIEHNRFKPVVNVPLKAIKTVPLPQEFKEPFYLEIDGQRVGMRLPRIKDIMESMKYAENQYAFEIQKYYEINELVNAGNRYAAAKLPGYVQYEEYVQNYNAVYGQVKQSLLLLSFNGEPLKTIEDKLEAYKEIDLRIWKAYSEQVLTKCKFGVKDTIQVKSPITKKSVERRFQFRIFDYFPDMESSTDTGISVQFGD